MVFRGLCCLLLTMLLGACTNGPEIKPVPFNPAATIATLSSSVSVAIQVGDKGVSGRGYLFIRQPDQFRLVFVSPFGATVAELLLRGDDLLYLDSSQQVAYAGKVGDLPDRPPLGSWRYLRWVLEPVAPPATVRKVMDRVTGSGAVEQLEFDDRGLLLRKRLAGNEVRFEEYQSIDGVPVPGVITLTEAAGGTVRLVISEPEVNGELEPDIFAPKLDGVRMLPLGTLLAP